MMKYINVEKLIEEIERFSTTMYNDGTYGDDLANCALDYVLEEIIPSLQQEQSEVNIEKEIDKMWKIDFNLGWDKYSALSINHEGFSHIAKHFYELGLNAKREEIEQPEQPEVEEEITDSTRACCNCISGSTRYPDCYCWLHEDCNTDEPYRIPKEDWVETATKCKEFEFERNTKKRT